jgi:hypothetical protein
MTLTLGLNLEATIDIEKKVNLENFVTCLCEFFLQFFLEFVAQMIETFPYFSELH